MWFGGDPTPAVSPARSSVPGPESPRVTGSCHSWGDGHPLGGLQQGHRGAGGRKPGCLSPPLTELSPDSQSQGSCFSCSGRSEGLQRRSDFPKCRVLARCLRSCAANLLLPVWPLLRAEGPHVAGEASMHRARGRAQPHLGSSFSSALRPLSAGSPLSAFWLFLIVSLGVSSPALSPAVALQERDTVGSPRPGATPPMASRAAHGTPPPSPCTASLVLSRAICPGGSRSGAASMAVSCHSDPVVPHHSSLGQHLSWSHSGGDLSCSVPTGQAQAGTWDPVGSAPQPEGSVSPRPPPAVPPAAAAPCLPPREEPVDGRLREGPAPSAQGRAVSAASPMEGSLGRWPGPVPQGMGTCSTGRPV